MSLYTEHVKIPHIQNVLQRDDLDCEQKLAELMKLIGQSSEDTVNAETTSEQSSSALKEAYEKILTGLTNSEKKIASDFLDEILKSSVIGFDPETLEISIHGEPITQSYLPYLALLENLCFSINMFLCTLYHDSLRCN